MNVLSTFDGMSCGQIALERANIEVDNYYASEIDEPAMSVTMHNYPKTKQLGSVTDVEAKRLLPIDLLIGGSPCQSFSFVGKQKGMSTKCEIEILTLEHYMELKNEGYEFEGQSYLFWEYVRILREANPKYFLLENVLMGEKWEKVISKALGVNPIEINSSVVSAQSRRRLYWTNIGLRPGGLFGDLVSTISQPVDKGLLLKDILESQVDDKYYLSDKMIKYLNKRKGNFNGGKINYKLPNDKASCINASSGHLDISDNIIIDLNAEELQAFGNMQPSEIIKKLAIEGRQSESQNQETQLNLLAPTTDHRPPTTEIHNVERKILRKLMPLEFERLQTVPDNYTSVVSDTQRYRMLGNGWTVDTIVHIFQWLKEDLSRK